MATLAVGEPGAIRGDTGSVREPGAILGDAGSMREPGAFRGDDGGVQEPALHVAEVVGAASAGCGVAGRDPAVCDAVCAGLVARVNKGDAVAVTAAQGARGFPGDDQGVLGVLGANLAVSQGPGST